MSLASTLTRGVLLASLSMSATGCSVGERINQAILTIFADPAKERGYRLVGAYDASSLRALEALIPEEERPEPYEYLWRPHPDMLKACGPTKAPDGLGIFEAEAMANRQLPSLALVVERIGDVPPLDAARVRVALGFEAPQFFLEPAVQPRYLQVAIEGDVAVRYKQQIKTQLQTYLCMEHKTGRGWIGGTGDQVRQALLLNPPDDFRYPDRKFFGGQNEPVPAILGPPHTCLKRIADLDFVTSTGGQGDSSLRLVPSDVWGASLTRCPDNLKAGASYLGNRPVEFELSEVPQGEGLTPARQWSQLHVIMSSEGDAPEEQFIEVKYQGREYVDPVDDQGEGVLVERQRLFESSEAGQLGLIDIVSKIPYRYPAIGDADEPERYAVLVIPNWQLVEGIRRLYAGELDKPRSNAGEGVQDGVGWVLENPDNLYIMVPRTPEDFDHLQRDKAIEWNNLARSMSSGWMGTRDWGNTAGVLAGRSPIALMGPETPSWDQVATAQRAMQHGLFLGAVAILGLVFFAGTGRLRDLWTRVPEERVEFWPGPPADEEGEDGDDMGELAAGEGDE